MKIVTILIPCYNEENSLDILYERLQLVFQDLNTRLVIQTLMSSCPYEMYWYDKTVGMKTASSLMIGAVHNGTEYCAYFAGTITFKFTVAEGYASETYSTDTSSR